MKSIVAQLRAVRNGNGTARGFEIIIGTTTHSMMSFTMRIHLTTMIQQLGRIIAGPMICASSAVAVIISHESAPTVTVKASRCTTHLRITVSISTTLTLRTPTATAAVPKSWHAENTERTHHSGAHEIAHLFCCQSPMRLPHTGNFFRSFARSSVHSRIRQSTWKQRLPTRPNRSSSACFRPLHRSGVAS